MSATVDLKGKDKRRLDFVERCPECNSPNLVRNYEKGELVCGDCGLVIFERLMDRGPDWRAFTREETWKKKRVGPPTTLMIHDKGLSTIIDWRGRDAQGRKLKVKRRLEVFRWRRWQIRSRIHGSLDRNLAQAMNELERIGSQLELPRNIMEEASLIYRKAAEMGLVRGRSIISVMAASIYAACRIKNLPRTLDEISVFTRSSVKDVARCYRLILKEVKVKVPLVNAESYISRIASSLNLSGAVQGRAAEILKEARKARITSGKDPSGLAAASLYIASIIEGERRTQKQLASAAGVTEVTVRNRYKDLVLKLEIELPT